MAYREGTADILRTDLADLAPTERKMFGGLAFMVDGNMICGVIGDGGLFRVGSGSVSDAMRIDGVDRMRMGERVMGGFVILDADGMADGDRRRRLVDMARTFVGGLSAK